MSYNAPTLPKLILTSTFLFLLPVTSHLSTLLTNTDLLGPLTLGILWCSPYLPPPAPLLPQDYIPFLSFLGYVGLILLIFDAGLSTPTSLLLDAQNMGAAVAVGLTGILVPIALSIALFHAGLWVFGAHVLRGGRVGDMKRSRVGVVLMSAALLDDVVGLVVAGVIGNLVTPDGKAGSGIRWSTIVRPVLVSLAYALGTPLLAVLARRGIRARGLKPLEMFVKRRVGRTMRIRRAHVHLFVIVGTLMAFVATTHLAGTSELFGAYLAGAFLGYTLLQSLLSPVVLCLDRSGYPCEPSFHDVPADYELGWGRGDGEEPPSRVARESCTPLLMILAKMVTAANFKSGPGPATHMPRVTTAILLGMAMVARGEIALIVAQLARPLLVVRSGAATGSGSNEESDEPYVIVMWAILVTTFAGALGVGLIIKATAKQDVAKKKCAR
ncbi:sodium-hydrogen antiporter [Ephemerocybe angulata]|uniref:Sodium-hydrogen antiporter n=1 Tax=Ephemerocybe angulata TaxID=980116 RepID=A0A8H6IGA3_9AGAR|nr:sodium-hydrogen antiporter [Tulosesus angulatus]